MKSLRIWVLLIIAWCVPTPAHTQSNPPFQSPALDSNCYFPQIGDPTEMDTIVGSMPNQYLGSPIIRNMGMKPNGSYGNMLIGNLVPPLDGANFYTLSQVETGPSFNLHHMIQYLQHLNPDTYTGQNSNGLADGFILGHFRDSQHLDIFDGRIYWADDNGNYDSSRFTVLRENIPVGHTRLPRGPILPWYVAHLTSDSVDDIVVSAYTD